MPSEDRDIDAGQDDALPSVETTRRFPGVVRPIRFASRGGGGGCSRPAGRRVRLARARRLAGAERGRNACSGRVPSADCGGGQTRGIAPDRVADCSPGAGRRPLARVAVARIHREQVAMSKSGSWTRCATRSARCGASSLPYSAPSRRSRAACRRPPDAAGRSGQGGRQAQAHDERGAAQGRRRADAQVLGFAPRRQGATARGAGVTLARRPGRRLAVARWPRPAQRRPSVASAPRALADGPGSYPTQGPNLVRLSDCRLNSTVSGTATGIL